MRFLASTRLARTKRQRGCGGFTLPELVVGLGVGTLLLAAAATLSVYGARTFSAIGSFADLDGRAHTALDVLSSKVRGASAVLACESNLPVKSLTLANPDANHIITLSWDSDTRAFTLEETDQAARTLLDDCDGWDFALYNDTLSADSSNITFSPAATFHECRLIDMSWKCSRPVPGEKIIAQSVEKTQITLRNAR